MSGGLGQPCQPPPTATTTATGLPTTVSTTAGTQTTSYDDFGQVTTYTDATGAKTLTDRDDTLDRVEKVTWTQANGTTTLGTQTYTYLDDSTGDHRGQLATIDDSGLGVITATYHPATGQLDRPDPGRRARSDLHHRHHRGHHLDHLGQSRRRVPVGLPVLRHPRPLAQRNRRRSRRPHWSTRTYGYDAPGRLTTVQETRTEGCSTRTYALDPNSNRTATASYPAAADGTCTTATTPSTQTTLSYDNADRLLATGTATGTSYDAWGRTTTLPAALTATPSAGNATATYFANDLVRSLAQGPVTRTWTVDPGQRLAAMTSTGAGATALTNHYSDGSTDSPTWTLDTAADATTTTRRYITGLAGLLAEAATGGTTTTTMQLTGLHGDVLRTTNPTASDAPDGPSTDADEFGVVHDTNSATTPGPRYGWLGGKQRTSRHRHHRPHPYGRPPLRTGSGEVRVHRPRDRRERERVHLPGGPSRTDGSRWAALWVQKHANQCQHLRALRWRRRKVSQYRAHSSSGVGPGSASPTRSLRVTPGHVPCSFTQRPSDN